jgi:hypothetical protein
MILLELVRAYKTDVSTNQYVHYTWTVHKRLLDNTELIWAYKIELLIFMRHLPAKDLSACPSHDGDCFMTRHNSFIIELSSSCIMDILHHYFKILFLQFFYICNIENGFDFLWTKQ